MDQLNVIENICGIKFEISNDTRNKLFEMYLVRNLGLHNRWEIDDKYKSLSLTKELVVGNIRLVTINELREWQEELNLIIHETSMKIAKLYKDIPEFILVVANEQLIIG